MAEKTRPRLRVPSGPNTIFPSKGKRKLIPETDEELERAGEKLGKQRGRSDEDISRGIFFAKQIREARRFRLKERLLKHKGRSF